MVLEVMRIFLGLELLGIFLVRGSCPVLLELRGMEV